MKVKTNEDIEFGDFQTPYELAVEITDLVFDKYPNFNSIIEPTCGKGNFLKASLDKRSLISSVIGWEINSEYVEQAKKNLEDFENVEIRQQDFFDYDWNEFSESVTFPLLFIGNPPWVTNSALGTINRKNLPSKNNFQKHAGFEAITGKSNFDISEWMLIKIAEFIAGKNSAMAFLIKTSVARKLFYHICVNELSIDNISIYHIDAGKSFNVSVDACLFYAEGIHKKPKNYIAGLYNSINETFPSKHMGFKNGKLIANIDEYHKLEDIDKMSEIPWRSGVKHDCSKIMEFNFENGHFVNGLKEIVSLPKDYLFPMYKSSNISKEKIMEPTKYVLITQTKIGEETSSIAEKSPATWEYLNQYSNFLDDRKSSIYNKAPKFAIFGIGDYSFRPWKIVISGLYKNLRFNLIGTYDNKPIMLDDTCYFLGFEQKNKAEFVFDLLTSKVASDFIQSIVFKDNKRPITVALLNRISLKQLAIHMGVLEKYEVLFGDNTSS